MADYSDFRDKNTKFTGTIGERISKGTSAERDTNSYGAGTFRFNTTLNLLEYFDGTIWKSIDAPPTVSSISPVSWASDGSTLETITITGSNFSVGATVKFVGADNTEYNSASVVRNSITEVTATTTAAMGVSNEPYSVVVTNNSGLSATLAGALDAGSSPTFLAASGSLGTLRSGNLAGSALTTFGNAFDADSTAVSYSVTTGSLPSGLSLGTGASAGTITGTAASVSVETTDTFTITGSDGFNTNSREFSITRAAPQYATFTSTGAFNWTIPAGVTGVGLLLVAGGGGSAWIGAGAGGGGVVEGNGYDVSPYVPGGSVPGSLGAGGPNAPGSAHSNQGVWDGRGGNTTFGTVTAIGGGSTSGWNQQANGVWNYSPGGCGGGGTGGDTGGTATQPTQPGFAGTNAHGFPGAAGGNHPSNPGATNGQTGAGQHSGGGGGGAGSAGGHPNQNGPGDTRNTQQAGRYGGYGYQSNYSGSAVTYAGGGAGSSHTSGYNIGTIPGSPGGGGSAPPGGGQSGTTNRGGGAGGGHYPDTNGGNGGPGFVAIVY